MASSRRRRWRRSRSSAPTRSTTRLPDTCRPRPGIASCCRNLALSRCSISTCGSAKGLAPPSPCSCCAPHSPAIPAWRPSPGPASPTRTPEPLGGGDGVEERAGDVAAPAARRAERMALPVDKLGERRVVSGRGQRRVVELMPAHDRTLAPDWALRKQPRLAIAEMELALREARGMAEQPGHGAAHAIRILEALAENHVAAALAMHLTRRGEAGEPVAETVRRGKPPRMQLGIAAGQPADVAALRRLLVGKGREGEDLGALPPPSCDEMRVDEGEGVVLGERDAHARRADRGRCLPRRDARSSCKLNDLIEIEVALGQVGEP